MAIYLRKMWNVFSQKNKNEIENQLFEENYESIMIN